MSTMILLCVLGGVCLIGAVLVMCYAFNFGKAKRSRALPGSEGGGSYLMTVEGLQTDADARKLAAALQAVPRTHAEVDVKTNTVRIGYEGFPALDLLDSLRENAEKAGFRVVDIA